jgi:recombination protein RecT
MSETAQIVPYEKKVSNVRDLLDRSKKQIAIALPKHITADRLLRVVMTAVQTTPKLLDCSQVSLIRAVLQAAQLGLEPNDGRGFGYLIPYKGEAQFQPGYKGLVDLARRSGNVGAFVARVARQADNFDYRYGTEEYIKHRPGAEESPLTHAYAIAHIKGGDVQFDVMEEWEVLRIRERSQGYRYAVDNKRKDNPWMTDEAEMWKKTVTKRICKMLPQSIELAKAIQLDNEAEMGLPQSFDAVVVEATATEVPTSAAAPIGLAAKAEERRAKREPKTTEPPKEPPMATAAELVRVWSEKIRGTRNNRGLNSVMADIKAAGLDNAILLELSTVEVEHRKTFGPPDSTDSTDEPPTA